MTFRIQRRNTQKVSLAVSSVIFAMAVYGIFTKNDNLFIIGLIFIGFILSGGILLSPIFGRFWCGWLCPRGVFLDFTMGSISMNRKIPRVFRSKVFRNMMLVVMILMLGMTLAGMNPVIKSANPLASLGGFLVLMCIITTIAMAIPLGLLYKPRTWCSFCPVGYIQSIISKKRLLKLKVENCVDCRKCEKECPIELNATQGSSDCFNCMQCVDVCSKKSIKPVISLE